MHDIKKILNYCIHRLLLEMDMSITLQLQAFYYL